MIGYVALPAGQIAELLVLADILITIGFVQVDPEFIEAMELLDAALEFATPVTPVFISVEFLFTLVSIIN